MNGNTGKIADINLSTGIVKILELPVDTYRRYIGGSGLAARIFWDRADFSADPLSPEAILILMNGPLTGIKLSGVSRMNATARSPLTGGIAESSCGGHFPPALRLAGFDGLILSGRAKRPSVLLIENESVSVRDAGNLWGMGVLECTRELKKTYGKKSTSLVIGPAGENGVPFACILNEAHHAFGRCGMGAVMGAKNLKALVVQSGSGTLSLADPDRIKSLTREFNPRIKDYLISQVLHDYGTSGNLEGHMYDGDVPMRNWTSSYDEEMASALTGSTLSETYLKKTATCAYCAVACKRIVQVDEGPFAVEEGPGPEYETVVAFGCLQGSPDLAAVCKAARICNDLGMDTISAGATIAWAMEAYEKGHLTNEQTDGISLKWGDMETVVNRILPAMAARSGKLGALLSMGSAAAARAIGGQSIEYTAQSKGLEAPMHDPRGGHGHAVAYAVSPRGACHVQTAMHFMETGACNYPEIGFEFDLEALTHEKKAETMVLAAAIGSIENSACLCQFADRSLTLPEIVELINAAAGYGYDVSSMMEAGLRIFHLKRCINYRFGLNASNDDLTPRLKEPARDGYTAGIEINFEEMKNKFYELMEFDPAMGVSSRERLVALGLIEEAKFIWPEK
ncbi:MAG TPA: aldehyde ferredoxin oxidoreductase family protein [Smithellaceae bacterium]|mgnify:FL=1|nr:aldehyde ferredoxin oxidoreductase family protein [Smithellaceae bacterium]HPD49918.1 aldehyde ferredoxin oxidoreductase family protein [Smithellaceae bacterium]HQG22519.1 aldehyde ferredoxin oxidoreductase family protein [Smithellaceae bacterium]HQK28274.1 aldehyde ferredoxin oxidoreductase family protein [Smithellaceae bacterium]HRT35486.1 aldehyde ferredoxin oxidoreductase family protein [Smithellaceae bacterium]